MLTGSPELTLPRASDGSFASTVATATELRRAPIGFTSLMDELEQEARRDTAPRRPQSDGCGHGWDHALAHISGSCDSGFSHQFDGHSQQLQLGGIDGTRAYTWRLSVRRVRHQRPLLLVWNELQDLYGPDSQRPFTQIPKSNKKEWTAMEPILDDDLYKGPYYLF